MANGDIGSTQTSGTQGACRPNPNSQIVETNDDGAVEQQMGRDRLPQRCPHHEGDHHTRGYPRLADTVAFPDVGDCVSDLVGSKELAQS